MVYGPGNDVSAPVSETEIPIVDLAPLLKASAETEGQTTTAQQIRHACISVGFLYLTNHGICPSVIDDMMDLMKRFFELPSAVKKNIAAHLSPAYRGFSSVEDGGHNCTPEQEACRNDLKESYTIGAERDGTDPRRISPLHHENQWPPESALPGFRETVLRYHTAAMQCMRAFMRGLAMALGLEDSFFCERTTDAVWQMVLLRYLPYAGHAGTAGSGCGAHTDCGFLTAVLQNEVPGLEVLTNEGRWVVAKPIPGTLVINLGDLLARWSNDLFRSSLHRVRSPKHETRYSCVFFLNCNFDTLVECVCKGRGEEAHYLPTKAGDYILERLGLMWQEGKGQDAPKETKGNLQ